MSHLRNTEAIPREVAVKRSDPIYNAHGYLTKVPVTAIEPFIEAFTEPGDTVLDLFAGSGMTGVAAAILGRNAELRDIGVLAQHIGQNYMNLVDPDSFRSAAEQVVDAAHGRLGDIYGVPCADCDQVATLSRTVWSIVYACRSCEEPINYYEAFKAADWNKTLMRCGKCDTPLRTRGSKRLGEEAVFDTVACGCQTKLRDQPHAKPRVEINLDGLDIPDVVIGEERQMFQASALARHNLVTVASFFSDRNLSSLAAVRSAIGKQPDVALREKLLFSFTAILARASKRYQWSLKRPLNAANQNYYIAPVFYEWNVYDLFLRKVEAMIRSDEHIRLEAARAGAATVGRVNYVTQSADALDLGNASVDYVFTDPPFGSNIFYSDMNLFQEAWLGEITDHEHEAVVDRSGNGETRRTTERYERLISDALREGHRVLKPDGWLSLVFSNSSGAMWALVQRAVRAAGFAIDHVAILDKGQRSVKGLASGFEHVVTVDLILSMRKAKGDELDVIAAPDGALESAVEEVLNEDASPTPSHVYVGVIRDYLRRGWDVTDLDIDGIGCVLQGLGYDIDARSGRLKMAAAA